MKFVMQFGLIAGLTLIGEILYKVIPFPIPASIWGMVILFLLLLTKKLKLEEIEDTADFLLGIMSIMYVPIGAELIVQYTGIKNEIIPIAIISVVSTLICFFVTGKVCELVMKMKEKSSREN